MKILVLNLLRLGDFIMLAPVITAIKQRYPQAQVDVLVHAPVERLKALFPDVDHWKTLNRDELQAGLGRSEIPLMTSFDVLRECCKGLNDEHYDLIINLTQTQFSGFLMGYLNSRSKMGLTVDRTLKVHFHSPWFRYLNQRADDIGGDIIHYLDIFASGADVGEAERKWNFSATEAGMAELKQLQIKNGELVVVQALTSDSKKNWGPASWSRWINEMCIRRREAQFVLLGAPAERESLGAIRDGLNKADLERVNVAVLSLDGALALLNRASLLVTGDTSIKHLANAARCKVLELSLGSSDYRRTGIYKKDSLIAQSRSACAPCSHSMSCSQRSHICGEMLDPTAMAEAAAYFMTDDWSEIGRIAKSTADSIRLLRTRHLSSGFWYAEDLMAGELVAVADAWFERSVCKFILNMSDMGDLPKFGTEGYQLAEDMVGLVGPAGLPALLSHLDFLESRLEGSHNSAKTPEPHVTTRGGLIDLSALRERQIQGELRRREHDVKSKLIRSIKSVLTEKL